MTSICQLGRSLLLPPGPHPFSCHVSCQVVRQFITTDESVYIGTQIFLYAKETTRFKSAGWEDFHHLSRLPLNEVYYHVLLTYTQVQSQHLYKKKTQLFPPSSSGEMSKGHWCHSGRHHDALSTAQAEAACLFSDLFTPPPQCPVTSILL